MKHFYTNVFVEGDTCFYRGYEKGKRVQFKSTFLPFLFVPTKEETNLRTLKGQHVKPIEFKNVRDARDFVKRYDNTSNFQIFGSTNFSHVCIYEEYPKEIEYDQSQISVVSLDIETSSEDGFPNIELADKEILTIAMRKNKHVVVFGTRDYRVREVKDNNTVTYVRCSDEEDLIFKFLTYWNNEKWLPDVVTGWNVEGFDIPYLINRITKLKGEDVAKKLSPWKIIRSRQIGIEEDGPIVYELMGISVLDYLALYKRFSYTPQESYRLDHIAEYELGERKLDYSEYETMHEFYVKDFQKFVDYNIHDVYLVDKLEEKLKFIEQVFAIAYDAKVNYLDTFTTVRIWDTIIHNYLMDQGIVVPHHNSEVMESRRNADRNLGQISGGYVKEPQIGMHHWVCSFDLNSLYPHLIMQYNISPDTFQHQEQGITVEKCLEKRIDENLRKKLVENNQTMTANGCVFDRDRIGFLPALMSKMYNDRIVWKQRLLEAKQANEKAPSKELQNEIARCHNMQHAKKIQLNSAYGALANIYFRWYKREFAEGVTTSGQLSTRWIEKHVNQYLNKLFNTNDTDYVIAADTDSMYIKLDKLVQSAFNGKEATPEKIVRFLDKVCEEKLQKLIDSKYAELAEYMNAMEQKMKMKREAIADKAIWTGKKHYIMNVYNLEGVQYTKPKLKIQGIESVRSSTPTACRKNIKKLLEIIMNENEEKTIEFIQNFRTEFNKLPFEEIAFPRSVNNMVKYADTSSIYIKGCPIHVKGSLIYNALLKEKKLENRFPLIRDQDKIKFTYLITPNPARNTVIASPGTLPKAFNLDAYIDYEMQFDKSFLEPIRTILDAVGWKTEKKATLESFFG